MIGYKKVITFTNKYAYDEYVNCILNCKKPSKYLSDLVRKNTFWSVLKLVIPEDAKIVESSNMYFSKLRCSKAMPVQNTILRNMYFNNCLGHSCFENDHVITSARSFLYIYKIGEMAIPDSFDADPSYECAHGIHFLEHIRKPRVISFSLSFAKKLTLIIENINFLKGDYHEQV